MTKLTKLMTLIPMVALGAACNGNSPVAPENVTAPEMGSAYDSPKSVDASSIDRCKSISGIDLNRAMSPDRTVVILASYVTLGGSTLRCPAPVWSSNPSGALLVSSSPFRARINPAFTSVTITATAANGVQGSIHIGLQTQAAAICQNIRSVSLKLVATQQQATVIQATYVAFGGIDTRCSAPVWTSNPRGALLSNSNPYRTGVDPSLKSVTVFATAPNGVRGRMTVNR